MSIEERVRFDALDSIRGMAALAVMLLHVTQHAHIRVFPGAAVAVDLFFCLSGFVLAHAYESRLLSGLSLRIFMVQRVTRLYPMYFFGLIIGSISLLIKSYTGGTNLSVFSSIVAVACNSIYIPYLGDYYVLVGVDKLGGALFPVNDPAWSLFFEFIVNFVFGFVLIYFRRSFDVVLALVGAIGFFIVWYFVRIGPGGWGTDNFFIGVPRVIYGFFSGVLVYKFYAKFKPTLPSINVYLIISIVAILLWFCGSGKQWLIATLFGCPILVLVGGSSKGLGFGFVGNFFRYFGWLSYPVYCVHFPIYSLLDNIMGVGVPSTVAAVLLSIASAHYLASCVEGRFRVFLCTRIPILRMP
jgi:peptidoglycan/LPS O-acetylase OafA/YrhL